MNRIILIHPISIIRNILSSAIKKLHTSYSLHQFCSLEEFNCSLLNKNDILIVFIQELNLDLLDSLLFVQRNGAKVIIWLGLEDVIHTRVLFQCGFYGYFTKEISQAELFKGVDKISKNESYIDKRLNSFLFKEYCSLVSSKTSNNDMVESFEKQKVSETPLTQREMDILHFLSKGYSTRLMAKELHLTESTIRNHVSSILLKLNVNSRTSAILKAYKKKWIIYSQIG